MMFFNSNSFVSFRKNLGHFPNGPIIKNSPANAGVMGLIPGWGRFYMPREKLSPGPTATERLCCNYWSLCARSLHSATWEATTRRSSCTATRQSPSPATKTQCILNKYFLKRILGLPWWSCCLRLCLLVQRVWVQSLVGELKSHTPWGQKPELKNRSNIITNSIKTLKMVHIKKSLKNKRIKRISILQRIFIGLGFSLHNIQCVQDTI